MSNMGVILGEATKRAKRTVGMTDSGALADKVHPSLAESAMLTSRVSFRFITKWIVLVFFLFFKYKTLSKTWHLLLIFFRRVKFRNKSVYQLLVNET